MQYLSTIAIPVHCLLIDSVGVMYVLDITKTELLWCT